MKHDPKNQPLVDAVFAFIRADYMLAKAQPRLMEVLQDTDQPLRDVDRSRLQGITAMLCWMSNQYNSEISDLICGDPIFLHGAFMEMHGDETE